MRYTEQPVRLGPPHCCACTTERGGICGHINLPPLCERHEAELSPLRREIAERRLDVEFADRLRIRVRDDRELLRRLSHAGG